MYLSLPNARLVGSRFISSLNPLIMQLHEIKKRVVILNDQQQKHIKGGTNDSTTILIGDIDVF